MKELSIEEKARAYDEALERAKKVNKCEADDREPGTSICEYIFPELCESSDEKIRKALIDGFTVMKESKNCGKTFSNHNIPVADILAWLEKQGEPKPTDKNEPKFKVGDKIKTANEESLTITKIDEKGYWSKDLFICSFDEECIWDLAEQKPVDKVKPFDKYEGLTDFERTLTDICIGWIGEEPGWKQYIKDNSDVLLRIAAEKFNSVQVEQRPAWGEEDEKMVNDIIAAIDTLYYHEMVNWLKSLKTRVGYVDKWEPSEEQMKVLSFYADQNNSRGSILTSLLDDLKKLRNK